MIPATLGFLLLGGLWGQDIDEDALFGDSTVVETPSVGWPAGRMDSAKAVEVRFGGVLDAVGQASWKEGSLSPQADGLSRLVGTGTLDVRLPSGARALTILELDHEGTPDTTSWALREMFLDVSVADRVWLRAGKQVLQWGRGMLWTPTDLVNVEGRTLIDRPGAREGATGLKVQVPFGTRGSLSAFAPLRGVDAAESLMVAVRAEMVLGTGEFAVSSRFRRDVPWALGFDGSAGLWGLDVQGGVLWLSGDPQPRAVLRQGAWHLEQDDTRAQVRASGGLGRAFRIGDVPDRLRIDLEGFWQSEGYGSEVLKDAVRRPFADTVWQPLDRRLVDGARSMGFPIPRGIPTASGDGLTFLAAQGLFEPNRHGPLYLGGMASLAKFLVPDMVLSVQGVTSVEDGSGAGALGTRWESLHGFHLQPLLWVFWGDPRTEYVLDGRGVAVELRSGIRF
ncbi:MAG: hypothetical protein H6686_02170 [Fibrobacteria bacterium]|nr:hypothetical protein [Fibrobacteria bacterium]